jgi:drug/metabolite transporter (DMT)-like permease
MKLPVINRSVLAALGAAVLFGASTPFAKQLVGDLPAMLLAGLLYLGSGIGLTVVRFIRDRSWNSPQLPTHEWPWLAGAIVFGGVLGPVLLMFGLTRIGAATASLLLNLEAVLTAVLAWVAFGENTDRRIVIGMLLIVAGGVVLSWPSSAIEESDWRGLLAIAGACLCWAIDNNLTRKVSASDALFIASAKGLSAGGVNTLLALLWWTSPPTWQVTISAMLIGFFGYGVSLVLFILALRGLGTARTGAYFSTAPFIGAAIATLLFHEPTTLLYWLATALMGTGVWLHLTERHEHEHTHETLFHSHRHMHDEHHQHEHEFDWDGLGPHTHPHRHLAITHMHLHFPDIHHRHCHN